MLRSEVLRKMAVPRYRERGPEVEWREEKIEVGDSW